MATPSTGPISASNVNTELGRPASQSFNLNDTLVRALAGKTSGTISFNDLRGKELRPTSFSPTDNATNVALGANIVITYSTNISPGTGSIQLRKDSATGTQVESYNVASSNRLTFSGNQLTVNPTANLEYNVMYYLVIPDYAIEGHRGTNTYNFRAEAAPTVTSYSPSDGATNQSLTVNWSVNFNKNIQRGTGTIRLRRDSNSGTVIQSYDAATSSRVTVSGKRLTIDPTVTLEYYKNYYMVIPSGAVKGWGGTSSWNIRTVNTSAGQTQCGGKVICTAGGKRWIVAPDNAEVTCIWTQRGAANSCAQQRTGQGGWFVPDCNQAINPFYKCRTHWNNKSDCYWTNNQRNDNLGWTVNMCTGTLRDHGKNGYKPVRSMKTVSY